MRDWIEFKGSHVAPQPHGFEWDGTATCEAVKDLRRASRVRGGDCPAEWPNRTVFCALLELASNCESPKHFSALSLARIGKKEPKTTARLIASGRRAHQMCMRPDVAVRK